MRTLPVSLAVAALAVAALPAAFGANHREAPITALDHKADIADVYAFVSYSENQAPNTPPDKVTLIMTVDPLLEPANGPTWFPFDPNILYEIKVDNNQDGMADVTFRFRFTSEYQLPGVYTALAGVGDQGAFAPGTKNLVVPPQIRSFDNPGLNLRQTYIVTMVKDGVETQIVKADGSPFYAVPANAGPRTMDYKKLFDAATYHLPSGMSVFSGTVDDPFWIDLGAAFDTANFRTLKSGVPAVLTDFEDSSRQNFAADTVSGYAVNAIAVEVPITMLTSTGQVEPPTSPAATIGVWATTSRQAMTVRRAPDPVQTSGDWQQVQRMGNPLINELIIGIGSKDRFSMDEPANDKQFADFFLDPPIVHIVEALYGGVLTVPQAPRTDLLPLVTYAAPIAAPNTPPGPIADLLRLNMAVPATPLSSFNRLGLIGGDPAGYPNGRRLFDDVTDIVLRVGVGGVLTKDASGKSLNRFPNNRLGDGVNGNDGPYRTAFPYLGDCPSGRNRRHLDPGEAGFPVQ